MAETTITEQTTTVILTRRQAQDWNALWGAMPYGGTYGVPRIPIQGRGPAEETFTVDFDQILSDLFRLRDGLASVATDAEQDRSELNKLRSQRAAIREFLGL